MTVLLCILLARSFSLFLSLSCLYVPDRKQNYVKQIIRFEIKLKIVEIKLKLMGANLI